MDPQGCALGVKGVNHTHVRSVVLLEGGPLMDCVLSPRMHWDWAYSWPWQRAQHPKWGLPECTTDHPQVVHTPWGPPDVSGVSACLLRHAKLSPLVRMATVMGGLTASV